MACADSATRSCCHPYATARSIASSVVGVAIRTRRAMASSISDGSASSAAPYRCSPGRNITTKSGAESSSAQ